MPENFCPLGRENTPKTPEWPQQPGKYPARPGRHPGQETAQRRAEEEEIQHRTADHRQQQIQPYPSRFQDRAADEQRRRSQKPEQQVRDFLEPSGDRSRAQQTQKIIDQPQNRTSCQRQQKALSLREQGDVHPRKSREKKPPWESSSS